MVGPKDGEMGMTAFCVGFVDGLEGLTGDWLGNNAVGISDGSFVGLNR